MRDVKGMGGRWSGVRGLRMEEEIISNRWKELDYDGYYLVSTVVLNGKDKEIGGFY